MRLLCSVVLAALVVTPAMARDPASQRAKITVVFDQVLPNAPGKSINGVLVEYGPGGSSPAHTHPKSAFIYATVLEVRRCIAPATILRSYRAIIMPSAQTRATPSPHVSWPSS